MSVGRVILRAAKKRGSLSVADDGQAGIRTGRSGSPSAGKRATSAGTSGADGGQRLPVGGDDRGMLGVITEARGWRADAEMVGPEGV